MADYTLDWSIDSVGPTINYGTTPVRYLLDYAYIPTGVGATSSITWMPETGLHNTNRYFDLPITLAADGTVSFYCAVSSESGYDGLRFYIDGVQKGFWSGTAGFGLVSFPVTTGSHTLRWAYTKDGSAISGSDTAWVALLKVTNVASVPPVKNSPKNPAIYDFEDGTIPSIITTSSWINSTNLPISGNRSLRTPVTTFDNQTYTATIAIPELPENGCVSLDYKSSSESGDRAWFTLDGLDYPLTYNQPLKKQAMVIPQMAGTHTLRVEYRKDNSLSQGSDALWIDNLHIPFQISPAGATINTSYSGSGTLGTLVGKRINLVTNPSFESGTTGWTPGATITLSQSTTEHLQGSASLKAVKAGTGSMQFFYGATSAGAPDAFSIPVTVGQAYTASLSLKGGAANASYSIAIYWLSDTAYLSYSTGSASTTTGSWQRYSATGTAPAGATKAAIAISSNDVATGADFYVDAVMLEKSATLGAFFDGATAPAGYITGWTGTPHASTSVATYERINLMPHPSSESADFLWTQAGTSRNVFDSAEAYVGTRSLKMSRDPGDTGSIVSTYGTHPATSAPTTAAMSVSAGVPYTASFWVKGGTNLPAVKLNMFWMTDTAYISFITSASVQTTSSWVRVTHTGTAPANATKLGLYIQSSVGVDGGTSFYADGFLVEKTASVGSYFDGSNPPAGYSSGWTGTPNASTSVASPAAATGGGATINTAYSGSGALSTTLTGYRRISSAFTGSGSLTTRLSDYININTSFSGSGVLTTSLTDYLVIGSSFSGNGVLATTVNIYRAFSSQFSGEGTLTSRMTGLVDEVYSDFDSEGVLLTELLYTLTPTPLDRSPLGRLVGYSVFTSAVPVNPAQGSGSVPSVSPSYIAGTDPEYVLGQEVEVKNNAVGTYRGEAVRVSLAKGSDVVALSTNTLVTSANTDLHLSPFIDSSPGKWTAARALDYWTQQAAVFYDDVPGDCVFYASGYGHTLAYAGDTNGKRCFEKTTGSTVTVVLSGRSVRNLGDDVTGTTAFHDDPEARVPLVLPSNRQLAFSVGLALRGTGRTSAVSWNLRDAINRPHTLKLQVTSAGAVTVTLNTLTLATATVDANGDYRFTLSLARASATAVSAKLTVHTDNLAGSGTLVHNGAPVARSYRLPGVMNLASVGHTSTGSSGAAMLRWGTYLAMVKSHPMGLPAVQKVFAQTSRDYSFVSGFTGNVWNLLNEFCSIARLDVRFNDGQLVIGPRGSAVVSGTKDSKLSVDAQRREKFKQVAVVNKQSKAVATETAVLWRADSVYQLNTREVFETTVQTPHSILSVVNPVPVPGIKPYPYTSGGGQYVVTGADGYIIAPQWWIDNGGKIEASLTDKDGEIALKITAPDVDSDVRAPYRISEGAADRPALYISGAGIINDPKELHIGTGATKAREGFESVFESPFIAGPREAFDVANRMAHEYSAAVADVDYELPNDFDTPTAFGQYPAGGVFTDNTRNYRLSEVTQSPSKVSGRAIPHTTIGAYKTSYPAGATIADEKARHAGRTIREFNIKPLRSQS